MGLIKLSRVAKCGVLQFLCKFIRKNKSSLLAIYDRVKKQQMLLCEWIRLTFEAHRRNMWFTSGLVYWMFNDCWPAANGWSIIDYYGVPKPGYYTFKRCASDMVSSVEKKKCTVI